MTKNKPQVESTPIKERILINLKKQGISSYDLLKEICECSRRDFAISMRELLRNDSIIRDKVKGGYRIKVR